MIEVLKHVYEIIGEVGSSSSPSKLAQGTGLEKKIAAEYLQKE